MALLYNLARMTTATTGTGTITLGSAVSGYLSFSGAGVANGDIIDYAIKDGSNSEIGTGTYTSSGTTLTRTVTKSTNANAAISLSGSAEVFISPRAETLQGVMTLKDSATSALSNIQNGNDGSNNYIELLPKSSGTPTFFYEDGSFETNNFGDSSGFSAFGYNYGGVVNGARFASSAFIGWSSTASAFDTLDVGIDRSAAGVLEINNGSTGNASGSLKLLNGTYGAGTSSVAPIKLTSGTNLTTATAGCVEFDGTSFYATAAASSRQIVNAEQVQVLSGSRTFTNNTSAQAIFNASANGAVTLAGSTSYEFEMLVAASGFSSSAHTINLTFATGGSFTSIGYYYNAQTGSTLAGPTAALSGFVAVGTATAVIASSTTTGLNLYVRGTIRMNSGGTVTPQLTQVTASAAAVVQANSFFRCWPIGTNTVTNVGNWS